MYAFLRSIRLVYEAPCQSHYYHSQGNIGRSLLQSCLESALLTRNSSSSQRAHLSSAQMCQHSNQVRMRTVRPDDQLEAAGRSCHSGISMNEQEMNTIPFASSTTISSVTKPTTFADGNTTAAAAATGYTDLRVTTAFVQSSFRERLCWLKCLRRRKDIAESSS